MSKVLSLAPFDFHVHSEHSHDGRGSVREYCQRAIDHGMRAIGFCEHVDLDPRDPVSGLHDYEAYRCAVEEARAEFGSSLMIRMGAEVGFVPSVASEIGEFLREHQYDYVMGSVHVIGDGMCGVSDEYEAIETFSRYEAREAYGEYLETVSRMVVSGMFDVVGHLDLVRRFGVKYAGEEAEWGTFYGVLRRILEGAQKRRMAVEINASGFRQAPEESYPCNAILSLYRELGGGDVMLGSDAHEPSLLGAGIPAAIKVAAEHGLDRMVCFTNRLPEAIAW